MTEIILLVGLKIPDTTAITTFHALNDLGHEVKKLKRLIYYKFTVNEDVENFKKTIVNTDILVNSNKNSYTLTESIEETKTKVLVQSIDNDCQGILKTLNKLGIKNIESMQQGILWEFDVKDEKTIGHSTEELLYNKHYQKVTYI